MSENSVKIYQVYHDLSITKKLKERKLPHYKLFYTKQYFEYDNINHVQEYLNEFVCQYYVYKKNIKSDIVGFCQYGKYFSNNESFQYGYETHVFNEKILSVRDLSNKVIGLSYYFNNDIINNKDNFYNLLLKYISHKYPNKVDKTLDFFKNISTDKMIRFESYICKWEDFCKYMEFILGLFSYYGIDLNQNISDKQIENKLDFFIIDCYKDCGWYSRKRYLAFFIELVCAVYWEIFDYEVIHNFKPFKKEC